MCLYSIYALRLCSSDGSENVRFKFKLCVASSDAMLRVPAYLPVFAMVSKSTESKLSWGPYLPSSPLPIPSSMIFCTDFSISSFMTSCCWIIPSSRRGSNVKISFCVILSSFKVSSSMFFLFNGYFRKLPAIYG